MTRRFEFGPILVATGALVLLVSLFLTWYGNLSAWGTFEITDLILAALAVGALVASAGVLAPELSYIEGRWLPAFSIAATVVVAAELISPPAFVVGADPQTGAWLGLAAALVMVIGSVLSIGKVSFSVAIEGRETRQRVAAVDHRQDTTESAAVVPDNEDPPEVPASTTRAAGRKR